MKKKGFLDAFPGLFVSFFLESMYVLICGIHLQFVSVVGQVGTGVLVRSQPCMKEDGRVQALRVCLL